MSYWYGISIRLTNVKLSRNMPSRGRGDRKVYLYPFWTPVLEWGGWSAPATLPQGRHPVPIAQKEGWASRLVWIMENPTSTGVQTQIIQPIGSRYTLLCYPTYRTNKLCTLQYM